MKCKACGEEFELERFPVCPFCMTRPERITDENEEYLFQTNEELSCDEILLLQNVKPTTEDEIVCSAVQDERRSNDIEPYLDSVVTKEDIGEGELYDKGHLFDAEENMFSKTKIEDIYPSSYKLFHRYCKRNNLHYMEELKEEIFEDLKSIKGLGAKSVSKLETIFVEHNPKDFLKNCYVSSFENELLRKYSVDEKIVTLNVDSLKVLGVSLRTINDLKNHNINILSDLSKASIGHLEVILKSDSVKQIMDIEKILNESPKYIFENILSEMGTSDNYVALLYRAEGFTLQETGDDLGVTRERVRQIVNKIQISLHGLARCVVDEIKNHNDFIYAQEVLDSFDNDDYGRILLYILSLDEKLEYLDFAEVFLIDFIKGKAESSLLKVVSEIIGDGADLLSVFSDIEIELHNLKLDFLDLGDIKNMLEKHNFKVYGTFVLQKRTSYGYLAAQLVKVHFKNGIRLNQNDDIKEPDLLNLRKLMLEKYEISNLPESDRALSSRISEFLIISDRGYAIAEENIEIDISVLEAIIERIDDYKEEKIFYTQLFEEFKGVLNMTSNVSNYHFLHGVLMHFYPNKYEYTRDYLIKERVAEGKSGMIHERILNYIEKNGNPVHKDEIKRIFGFSDIMIYTAMSMENRLIQWEHNYYNSANLIDIRADEVRWLRGLIADTLCRNDGYCSERMLYVLVKNENEELIIRNNINSPKNLFYIASFYFEGKFDFRRPHICEKGKFSKLNTMDIALDILERPEILSFNVFSELSKKFNWSPVTSGAVFQEIEKGYVRVSSDEYLLRESFIIEEADVCQIEKYLIMRMESGVLSLLTFEEWEELPDIGLNWNSFLLGSVIEEFSLNLKVIEPNMRDRRYQKGIVVKIQSDLSNYPEVIASVLEANELNEISEGKMLSYLIVNGLTYKMIPKELYKCDEMSFKKGMFSINGVCQHSCQ